MKINRTKMIEALRRVVQRMHYPHSLIATEPSIVLRYGWFYGPGTSYDPEGTIPRAIRNGTMPIVGAGAGTYSFIDLRDAAAATI